MQKPLNRRAYDLTGSVAPLAGEMGDGEYRRVEGLLRNCEADYENLDSFRLKREKNVEYVKGNQWRDTVPDPDNPNKQITERQAILDKGLIPAVHNMFESIRRNMKGQFRQNVSERAVFPTNDENEEGNDQMNMALRGVRRHNQVKTLEADGFDEFTFSGACLYRVSIDYDSDLNRNEVIIDTIESDRMFFNGDIRDRRMEGLVRIGCVHDMRPDDILVSFGNGENGEVDDAKVEMLRDIYQIPEDDDRLEGSDNYYHDTANFYNTGSHYLRRVIEVWQAEREVCRYLVDYEQTDKDGRPQKIKTDWTDAEIAEHNDERVAFGMEPLVLERRNEKVWKCYYLSPYGDVLFAKESPYWHEKHPFELGFAAFIDGEIVSFYEALIDPQRLLNRTLILIDSLIAGAPKGLLSIPKSSVPDGSSEKDMADQHSRPNGYIVWEDDPQKNPLGNQPEIKTVGQAAPNDTYQMLEILKGWMDQQSGVTGPTQGLDAQAGTPATLYHLQQQAASVTNLDVFESYFDLLARVDKKVVACIMQSYDEPRRVVNEMGEGLIMYDPETVRELSFEVNTAAVADTATYRLAWEDTMQQWLAGGFIDFQTYLQFSGHPQADRMLKHLKSTAPEILEAPAAMVGEAAQQTGLLNAIPQAA